MWEFIHSCRKKMSNFVRELELLLPQFTSKCSQVIRYIDEYFGSAAKNLEKYDEMDFLTPERRERIKIRAVKNLVEGLVNKPIGRQIMLLGEVDLAGRRIVWDVPGRLRWKTVYGKAELAFDAEFERRFDVNLDKMFDGWFGEAEKGMRWCG
ncbi:hypothetical protein HDV00_010822 [Rhizophlyctis rosea]|nr:hypothetical protein HDV00_010822 [Rhizophlyctis rosea]